VSMVVRTVVVGVCLVQPQLVLAYMAPLLQVLEYMDNQIVITLAIFLIIILAVGLQL